MMEHLHIFDSLMQSASKLSIQKMRSGITLASLFARAISCFCVRAFFAACISPLSESQLWHCVPEVRLASAPVQRGLRAYTTLARNPTLKTGMLQKVKCSASTMSVCGFKLAK